MAQHGLSITVHIGMRWWLKPAMKVLLAAHRITGWTPSEAHIHALAKHGTYCHDPRG